MSYQVEQRCAQQGLAVTVVRRFASYVEFSIAREAARLKVDLAQDSPFRFEPPERDEHGVMVNSLIDLRVDKLLAYYGRAELRDAVDLFWIMRQTPIQPLLQQAGQKDPGFDLYWLAVALNRAEQFPDDMDRWPVKMLQPFEPAQLKQAFAELGQAIMDQLSHQ